MEKNKTLNEQIVVIAAKVMVPHILRVLHGGVKSFEDLQEDLGVPVPILGKAIVNMIQDGVLASIIPLDIEGKKLSDKPLLTMAMPWEADAVVGYISSLWDADDFGEAFESADLEYQKSFN